MAISGRAGKNATFMPCSGIGTSWKTKDIGAGPGMPLVGDEFRIGFCGGILGPFRIGDSVWIGFGASVTTRDIPSDVVAVPRRGPVEGECKRRPSQDRPVCVRDHGRWRNTIQDLRTDIQHYTDRRLGEESVRLKAGHVISALLTTQILSSALYRLSHLLFVRGWRRLSIVVCWLNILINKATIHPGSCIGPRAFLPHPSCFAFSGNAGSDFTCYALSLATPMDGVLSAPLSAGPILGDDVVITGHAGVLGPATVGEGGRIFPKALVTSDMGPHAMALNTSSRGSTSTEAPAQGEYEVPTDGGQASPQTRREVVALLREDRRRMREELKRNGVSNSIKRLLFPAYLCVWLYRWSHYFHRKGFLRVARACWLANVYLTGADIAPRSRIGGGLYIPQPAGVFICGHAGSRFTVMVGGMIGPSCVGSEDESASPAIPEIGDNVTVSHHAGVQGPVRIGNDVFISPGCIVYKSTGNGVTLLAPDLRIRSFAKRESESASS